MNQKLIELSQQIEREFPAWQRLLEHIETGWQKFEETGDRFYVESVALNLHSFYTKIEVAFQKIARIFSESWHSEEKWHQTLVDLMVVEKPGVRPAVISVETRQALDEYRRFRHLVRNIYPFDLESERIQPLVDAVAETLNLVRSDLQLFISWLRV